MRHVHVMYFNKLVIDVRISGFVQNQNNPKTRHLKFNICKIQLSYYTLQMQYHSIITR